MRGPQPRHAVASIAKFPGGAIRVLRADLDQAPPSHFKALGFTARHTAHYIAPVISWAVGENSTLRFSPGFGVTENSNPVLLRFGYSYEIQGFGTHISRLFGRRP